MAVFMATISYAQITHDLTLSSNVTTKLVISANGYFLDSIAEDTYTPAIVTISSAIDYATEAEPDLYLLYMPLKNSGNKHVFRPIADRLKDTDAVTETTVGTVKTRTWLLETLELNPNGAAELPVVGEVLDFLTSGTLAVDENADPVVVLNGSSTPTATYSHLGAKITVVEDYTPPIEDFEGGADSYETGLSTDNGNVSITEDVSNPNSSGINTSAKVLELVKNDGAKPWDRFRLTSISPAVSTENGSFFTLKFRSPKASGEVSLSLGGSNTTIVRRNFNYSGTTIGDWILAEFDYSDNEVDVTGVTRFDIAFDWSSGVDVSGSETYYIDDIQQAESSGVLNLQDNVHTLENTTVYPNPSTGLVTISNIEGMHSISVSNVLGQVVKTFAASNQIDISSLQAGVYILLADNGFQTKVVKN